MGRETRSRGTWGWRLMPESTNAPCFTLGVNRYESMEAVPKDIVGFEATLRW